MHKTDAIQLLGDGVMSAAAQEMGISPAALSQWPEELPPRLADRVQAALWRRANPVPAGAEEEAA